MSESVKMLQEVADGLRDGSRLAIVNPANKLN
jgi:hypothetical protein